MKYKMYCIFAMESIKKMGGNRGKLSSMAGHAFLHSFWDATSPSMVCDFDTNQKDDLKQAQAEAYQDSGLAGKITLVVDTVEELEGLQQVYKNICGTSLVTDAARTVFDEPTTVCLGIGPIAVENIGDDIKALKVLI